MSRTTKMIVVTAGTIALNMLWTAALIVGCPPMPAITQVIFAVPLAITNVGAIRWLDNGGRWYRRRRKRSRGRCCGGGDRGGSLE